ncbi:MAG TPA: Crp/Fnr family transcriptional regulator [Trueperaceae bacterium]
MITARSQVQVLRHAADRRLADPFEVVGAAPDVGVVLLGERVLRAGERLYAEGEPPTVPYLVGAGVLRVSVDAQGRSRLVDLVGRGDVIGTAAVEDRSHAESVDAAETGATVHEVDLAATLAIREHRQAFVSALVRQLVRSRQLADDLGLPMGARICRILARLAERLGEEFAGPTASDDRERPLSGWRHLPFSLTHDDVALMAGCARVTATRVLGDLKEAGVLDGARGDYALIPAALDEAADRYVWDVI